MNWTIAAIFTVAYIYQLLFVFVGFVQKNRKHKPERAAAKHKLAALICARNEEGVITELITSLKKQKYPSDKLDIYVLADNCTDNTARVAREAGAIVYERWNCNLVGKGYAMDYLLERIHREHSDAGYEAYLVFDADNLVDASFAAEMNKVFDRGYDVITCYRNSKNFAANWISASYSIWFLREARFLNFPRMLLGTNCAISGTGFLVAEKTIRENGGWPFHLLTEDIEFSANCAVNGTRIGYCDKAVVYDEQPTTFRQSWDQRMRWSKGFYQVNLHYSNSLLKGILRGGRMGFSCYDILMTIAPGMLLTLLTILFNGIIGLTCLSAPYWLARLVTREVFYFIGMTMLSFYFGLFMYGCLTVLVEWNQIRATSFQKVRYLFAFPVFMFTYVPISLVALVTRVQWKQIQHTSTVEMNKQYR